MDLKRSFYPLLFIQSLIVERKKRHILKKDWTRLRSDIERVRKEFHISNDDFRELKINEWKKVEDEIGEIFFSKKPPKSNWIWNLSLIHI